MFDTAAAPFHQNKCKNMPETVAQGKHRNISFKELKKAKSVRDPTNNSDPAPASISYLP